MRDESTAPEAGERETIFDTRRAPTDDELRRVAELAAEQLAKQEEVERLTLALDGACKELDRIRRDLLPGAMDEVGLEEARLLDGSRISIEKKVRASIPVPRRPEAYAWLRERGHDIVKNEVVTSFGKGEESGAEGLLAELQARGLVVAREESVHPSTLGAFVREQLREGAEIPLDLFGVFEYREAKILPPGARAPRKGK